MNRRLLDILRCPHSGQPLRLLTREELAALNARIAEGGVVLSEGEALEQAYDEALITANGEWVYAVEDGVPVMLPDRALAARELDLEA